MFLKEMWANRRKILLMSTVDFKSSFKASVLSWFWVLINPILTIAMYLFAFAAGDDNAGASGLKIIRWDPGDFAFVLSGNPDSIDVNQTAWLIAGVLAWGYISSMMSGGAGSIRQYNWMVTKIGTPLSVPPAVVCVSRSIIGIPLIIVSWFIYMIIAASTGNENVVSWQILQLPLMILLSFGFMLLWSLFISPFASISKDVNNFLAILPLFLQWVSGTFIPLAPSNFDSWMGWIFRINPLNFLLDNIRGAITGATFFWNDAVALISFIVCFGILFALASIVNRKKIKKIVVDLV